MKQHQRSDLALLLVMNPHAVDVGEAAVSGVGQGPARLVEVYVGGAREPEERESDEEDYDCRKRETNQLFHLHRCPQFLISLFFFRNARTVSLNFCGSSVIRKWLTPSHIR